jgi:hemolysin activation/secretion protein
MRKLVIVAAVFLGVFAFSILAFSQPPASQTAGGVAYREKETQKQQRLDERIKQKRSSAEEAAPEDIIPPDIGPKVLINKIVVEGAVLLSEQEIRDIVSPFEETELSMQGMQRVAELITDAYRKKGYLTSRAYIPPQTVQEGTLIIRVVEGKLGELEIKGNRYFSTPLLRKKINIEPAGYFDYSALQRSLIYINEHPDRMVKAILTPGREPGTTDIIIEVEDELPFHMGFYYDNYGSRYIGKDRYSLIMEHNNLFGQDDTLFLKGQFAESSQLLLQQARYTYPVSQRLELGGHLLFSKLNLGHEFKDLDSEGEAKIYGIFSNYSFIDQDDLELRLNLGFDYKEITNDLSGAQLSRDELSIFKVGFDLDAEDAWGRTVFTAALNTGIADFLGSMAAKDPNASRTGAGGKFTKGVFNLFRLQPMPFSTWLLLKNSFQISNYTLAASEQFQIGGATSVRGYPPGEYSGDDGLYSAVELSLPCYGLSKDINVPFRKEKLYDALHFVLFWDFGWVNLNNVQAGEEENETLRSAGFGARLTIAEDLECRVELGYPLGGKTPSDGNHAHTWVEFRWKI